MNGDGSFFDAAKEDVLSAQTLFSYSEPMAVCAIVFHIQQAAEKMVKHVLNTNGVQPAKTHQIELLLSQAKDRHLLSIADEDIREMSELSGYAVEPRYPPWQSQITQNDVTKAKTLYNKLISCLERNGYPVLYIN